MKPILALLLFLLPSVRAADLLVAAASDLAPFTASLQAAGSKALGVGIKFTLASSGSIAQQVANGAPFDVFLSANQGYVDNLVKGGFVAPSGVMLYAYGRIALWSKDGSVHSFEDLRKPSVTHIAIPNPEHAPYGVAARQALERRGLWKDVQSKIVYGENVRQSLQFAESGNADAVITSWTLLDGRGVLLPQEWHDPIRQAGAVIKASTQQANARRFLQFLRSPEGRKILSAGGLFPPQP